MAGLDEYGKLLPPHLDVIPETSSPQRVAIPAELSRPTVSTTLLRKATQVCKHTLLAQAVLLAMLFSATDHKPSDVSFPECPR